MGIELIYYFHMEPHFKTRPKKKPFPIAEQRALREKAEAQMKELLLPHNGVKKIVLMGSSVKGTFGKYEPPGFRGSRYSDFDFIVFISYTM